MIASVHLAAELSSVRPRAVNPDARLSREASMGNVPSTFAILWNEQRWGPGLRENLAARTPVPGR